jgi:hypothetical protein
MDPFTFKFRFYTFPISWVIAWWVLKTFAVLITIFAITNMPGGVHSVKDFFGCLAFALPGLFLICRFFFRICVRY